MGQRAFKKSDRALLYIAADGKCEMCGAPLRPGWHADHVHPYSRGGKTSLTNAQALCPACNLKKGDRTDVKKIELREFQRRFVNTAIRKAEQGQRVMVADVHAGSGKTLAACAAADRLMALGYIDQVVVFVPRLNLAHQFELDWKIARPLMPWQSVMGELFHRPNDPPLLLDGASGYVSTYSSLVSQPILHLRQIASRRTLVIFDEADRLGSDEERGDFTQSALRAEQVGEAAAMVFVMSGTPVRADGKPLLFATYTEPDENGFRSLSPDVSSTYRDGVRDGYLRRFDFRLADGGYTLKTLNGEATMAIEETEKAIGSVLEQPEIYEPLVDTFVERLNEHKRQIDPRLCGLVAANRQSHAKAVQRYIKKRYPHLKTLIAVSDDGEVAHQSLRQFKRGQHDVLITVSMAYVGYDHKPISVLLLLTGFRSESYLRQLVARGLRMWAEVPAEKQFCLAVAPNDKRMVEFVEKLRGESNWGYEQRLKLKEQGEQGGEGDYQSEMAIIKDGFISELRSMGIDPTGDLSPEELRTVQRILDERGLPYPAPDMMAIIRAYSSIEVPPIPKTEAPQKTMTEQMNDARSTLRKLCGQCDYQLSYSYDSRETAKRLFGLYGSVSKAKSVDEIEQRVFTVQRWMKQGRYDDRR